MNEREKIERLAMAMGWTLLLTVCDRNNPWRWADRSGDLVGRRWNPFQSQDDFQLVIEEIERRGLLEEYQVALDCICQLPTMATPAQKADAALAVLAADTNKESMK